MEWMKKTIWLIVIVLLCSLVSADDLFTNLKTNDETNTYAVFSIDNYYPDSISKSSLTFKFTEDVGEVLNYRILKYGTYPVITQIPQYKETESCEDIYNNNISDFEHVCMIDKTIVGYTQDIRYVTEYRPFDELPIGEFDYKIEMDLALGKTGNGWGYVIDWVPCLEIEDYTRCKSEWEWINESWEKRKPINITNNNATFTLAKWSTINITINTSKIISDGDLQADCDDLMIAYNGTGTAVFLDKDLLRCNDAENLTMVKFGLQKNITGGATSSNEYWLYFDNPTATTQSSNLSEVYYFECDYSSNICGMIIVGSRIVYDATLERLNFSIIRNSDDYIYKDLGASVTGSNINGFEVQYKAYYSYRDDTAGNFYTGMGSTLNDLSDYWNALDGSWIWVKQTADGWNLIKTASTNVFSADDHSLLDDTIQYLSYVHLQNSPVQSAYWFNDSSRQVLQGSITGATANINSFKYFFLINGYNAGDTKHVDGWLDDVKLIRRITPNPTFVLGDTETLSANNPPNVTTPSIIPTDVFSNSKLNCSTTPLDIENVSLQVNFAWWLNGGSGGLPYNVTIPTTNNTLTYTTTKVSEQLMVGDNWSCMVRAWDGEDYSGWVNVTKQVLNTNVTWTQLPQNVSFVYTENVSYDVNATDIDTSANQDLYYYINTTDFTINVSTGLINKTTNVSHVGNYSVRINVTDGVYWLNASIIIEITNSTSGSGINPTALLKWEAFDVDSISNVLMFGLLVFIWFACLVVGISLDNIIVLLGGCIIGIIVGFTMYAIQPFLCFVVVLMNIAILFFAFIGE